MMEDIFQTCDSPSGSSTSEPHEEMLTMQPLSFTDPSFFRKSTQLTSDKNTILTQQNNRNALSSPPLTAPSFVDPLVPSSVSADDFGLQNWLSYNNNASPTTPNYIEHPRTTENSTLNGMQIRVLGVPQTGAKSRVETQIKLCIQLVTDSGDKAQRWSHLKLPEHMVSKEKLKRQTMLSTLGNSTIPGTENPDIQPQNVLYLSARVICASDPSRKVATCSGCIQRERKRSQRRKENKNKSPGLEDERVLMADEHKILLFNCPEVVDFSSGDTILPTRITCYCRHHNERLGFCIYFEMRDYANRHMASGMSPPIMITDDHKSSKLKMNRKRPRTEPDSARFTSFDSKLNPGGPYQIQPRPRDFMKDAFMSPEVLTPDQPLLQRLIPSEGPTYGGIEVTLLGSGFRSGLTCMFGDVPASSTHFWSPNTLVCILPPAADASKVVVSFKEYPVVTDSQEVTVFSYYNENDRALMELALQVVGLKMTGKVEDAREIAMRIVQGGDTSQSTPQPQNLEQHITQVLKVMTTFRDVCSADVSITSTQGHTMLHYAAMLGWNRLSRMLLDLGCEINTIDNNGLTALHYAVWHSHSETVRLLLEFSADVEVLNCWNKKPFHMAKNAAIRQIISEFSCGLSASEDDDSESLCLSEIDWPQDNPLIQYLDDVDSASYSPEEIIDAEPLYAIDPSTDDEEHIPKEKSWMQRTLSHFQPNNSSDLLQNFKNAKPTTDLKGIADHILQLPSRPLSGLFSNSKEEEAPDQALAWYMALAYAMGTRSIVSEDEKEEPNQEECTITNKRRDRTLYSFWVPMLCVMITWLIFQFISSNPNVTDTIVSVFGFRRQYHIIQ
ncbi:hypothetical protein BY458DRAFT_560347 [Sporodiniella umbellata]|nr:hypothetical protein BY458DRAFT_560347 [Sporodiniella umbellata]